MDQCLVRMKMCRAAAAWRVYSAQGTGTCKHKEKRHRLLRHPVTVTVYKSRNSQQSGAVTSVYTCSTQEVEERLTWQKLGTTQVLVNKDEEMKIYLWFIHANETQKLRKLESSELGMQLFCPGFRPYHSEKIDFTYSYEKSTNLNKKEAHYRMVYSCMWSHVWSNILCS